MFTLNVRTLLCLWHSCHLMLRRTAATSEINNASVHGHLNDVATQHQSTSLLMAFAESDVATYTFKPREGDPRVLGHLTDVQCEHQSTSLLMGFLFARAFAVLAHSPITPAMAPSNVASTPVVNSKPGTAVT